MNKRAILLAVAVTIVATTEPVAAQFSSDFPGVPRASISVRGGKQSRTEWIFRGYKVSPETGDADDTVAGGLQLGFGRSYRIQSRFEIGFDFTLLEGAVVNPPKGERETVSPLYFRGLAGYGFRIGGKFRPISSLDPDGYGYEVAFGAAFQPALKPLFGVEHTQDTTRTGGQFSGDDEEEAPGAAFPVDPMAKLHSTTTLAAMGSYRSRRLNGDAALVLDNAAEPEAGEDPSPIGVFDGVSLRAGASYRVRPSIAIGATFWGNGAPPWRDEVALRYPGEHKASKVGVLFQFGRQPEAGVDLMISSPTHKFSESARLYVRVRSTR